jgi:hypothetical protein
MGKDLARESNQVQRSLLRGQVHAFSAIAHARSGCLLCGGGTKDGLVTAFLALFYREIAYLFANVQDFARKLRDC